MQNNNNGNNGSKRQGENKKKKFYDQLIFRAWCKSCGICAAFCPKNVIGRNEAGEPIIERPDECIGCRFCEVHCPDFAITIIDRGKEVGAGGDE